MTPPNPPIHPASAHGFLSRRVGSAAVGKLNAARFQKARDAVAAGLAVDVGAVIGNRIERPVGFPEARGPPFQEGVEHRFPRRRVQLRGLGDDAVQVEQDRVVVASGNQENRLPGVHESLLDGRGGQRP
jgi:hypothetical protein